MLFLDTSALLKRYVEEDGTDLVLELMAGDPDWAASNLAQAETEVTLCQVGLGEVGTGSATAPLACRLGTVPRRAG